MIHPITGRPSDETLYITTCCHPADEPTARRRLAVRLCADGIDEWAWDTAHGPDAEEQILNWLLTFDPADDDEMTHAATYAEVLRSELSRCEHAYLLTATARFAPRERAA